MSDSAKSASLDPSLCVIVLAAGKWSTMNEGQVVFQGLYISEGGGEFVVRRGGRRLILERGDRDLTLLPLSESEFVLQAEQKGTGHAVMQALPRLADHDGDVLVLYGDTPLLRAGSLEAMRRVRAETGAGLVMLTSPEPLPGLVVRDADGRVLRIVEQVDATPEEAGLREGNTGVYLMGIELLRDALASLEPDNSQGELYLTGVVPFAVARGERVEAIRLDSAEECIGVNTRAELAAASRVAPP